MASAQERPSRKPVGVAVGDRLGYRFEGQRVERLHGAVPQGGMLKGRSLPFFLGM